MSMTLLQLAVCFLNVGEGIDAGNRDFQFSLVDKLGEMAQDRRARCLRTALDLDAILCRSLKVDDRVDNVPVGRQA